MRKMKQKIRKVIVASLLTSTVMCGLLPNWASSTASADSEISNNSIVVSTVIPTSANTESISKEVEKEVRIQEALEKEIRAELREKARTEKREKYKNYINEIVCDPSDVTRVSNIKESHYELLTKGTWWEGNEQALIDLEKTYNVNAMFAIAVSTLESGHGMSDRAKNRNNYYGLETRTYYDSLYHNTQVWGNIIHRYYNEEGRISVYGISTKYCPPHSDYWADYMNDKMSSLYNDLINRLNDKLKDI